MQFNFKRLYKELFRLLVIVFMCGLSLSLVTSSVVYAETFVGPSTLSIDGTFSDWGTVGSPSTGVYLVQDMSNSGEQDGSGFNNKASDINYLWTALSTQNGGSTPASPSNLIQNLYYRLDTHYNKVIKGQSYYLQLNIGTADPGYADHLLQFWVDDTDTPEVTIVFYEYDTPYPQIRAFTSGSITGKVSNVATPYSGFTGVQDTSASGAMGKYDETNYGVEIELPVDWFSSIYGGAVKADGTGASVVVGATFTGTGSLGAIGTVKDTVNDVSGDTYVSTTSTVDGETQFVNDDIAKIIFTTGNQTLAAGEVSSIMTIQTQDATSAPQDVSATTIIDLSSTSGAGRFDTSPSGAFDGTITSVTVASGNNAVSFYYKDTTAGTPTITAAENPDQGWSDATQQETITALVVSPTVTTSDATLVEETTATIHGTLTSDGGEASQYRFQWGTTQGGPYTDNISWIGSKTTGQSFSADITGLSKGTKYYFIAEAKNSAGTGSSSELSFLTKPDPPVNSTFSAAAVSSTQIDLTWTMGEGAYRTMIRRKTGDFPVDRNDGSLVYFDTGTGVSDTGLSPATTYYYRAWSEVSGSQQWSDGYRDTTATTSGAPPAPPTAVGGIVYPVSKAQVLAPWLCFFLVLSLAVGRGVFVLRKRMPSTLTV